MIRPLFDKYQRHLLAFANTSYGRDYLSIGKHDVGKIVRITPDSIHYLQEDQIKAVFFSNSPYLKKFDLALTGLDIVAGSGYKIKDSLERVIPHFGGLSHDFYLPTVAFTTGTFYPDAHAESTSVDGVVAQSHDLTANLTWAQLRASAGNSADDDNTEDWIMIFCDDNTSNFRILQRLIFLFDTSTLTSSATITSASLSLYGAEKLDQISITPSANVVSSAPASNTALVAGDFDSLGTTKFCDTDISYASWNTSGYNSFTLNATGLAAISKTSITKLGLKEASYDITGTTPGWSNNLVSRLKSVMSDNGSNKPTLSVTYTLPSGAMFFAQL